MIFILCSPSRFFSTFDFVNLYLDAFVVLGVAAGVAKPRAAAHAEPGDDAFEHRDDVAWFDGPH